MDDQTSPPSLTVRIEYDNSIELKTLGDIFYALSGEYSEFTKNHNEYKDTTLSIGKIRKGSIYIDITIAFIVTADDGLLYTSVLTIPFIFKFFKHLKRLKKSLESKFMRKIAKIVENAKKRGERHLNITFFGDINILDDRDYFEIDWNKIEELKQKKKEELKQKKIKDNLKDISKK